MAGYKSVSFDASDMSSKIAAASDAASDAISKIALVSDAASDAQSKIAAVSDAASKATVKAAAASSVGVITAGKASDASSAVAARSANWDKASDAKSKATVALSKITAQSATWVSPAGQLIENTSILLDSALSADGKYTAIEAEAGVLGNTIAFGETIYQKADDSRWWKTDATTEATSGPVRVGFCALAGNAGDATIILFEGTIRADSLFDTFTKSAPVFLSAATAGKISSTAPSGTDDFVVRVVGHAIDGNSVAVKISPDYYTIYANQWGSHTTSFTIDNLSSGVLTVTHNFGNQYCSSPTVTDNNGMLIIPDEVTYTSATEMTIDISSYGAITGTWRAVVLDVGASNQTVPSTPLRLIGLLF